MSRRSDQRRAAVFALYQHDVTGRELDDLFERDASTFTRALAYAAQDYGEDLDGRIERHARAGRSTASRRWSGRSCASPCSRWSTRRGAGRRPDPGRGAISEAVETAKQFCGAEAPGFVNGILAAALREMGENGAYR
jgi:N utilization substance protein B